MDGPAGYGKSTTVTKLIDDLQAQHPVAYFFCRVGQAGQGWEDIVRTWIWQLLDQRPLPEFIAGVHDVYVSTLGTASTPLSSFFKALLWLVKALGTSFILLDGMDENPELAKHGAQGLTAHFRGISRHAKIFTSSRPDPSIRYTIPTDEGGFIRIAINDNFNQDDIENFLADGVGRLGWNERISNNIQKRLADGAKGMFLWAKLMLQHIREQVTLDDLEAALRRLPDGISGVYAQIISKIACLPASKARTAAGILQWVYSSARPLTVVEMDAALAVQPGSSSSLADKRHRVMNLREFIADICGSLLEIHERSGAIQFAHAAAIQYLKSLASREEPMPYDVTQFPLVLAKRVPCLAATCLTYIAYDDVTFVQPNKHLDAYAANLNTQLQLHPFLRYATLELWTHFEPVEDDDTSSAGDLTVALSRFFANESSLVKWLQLYQLLGGLSNDRSQDEDRFHPEADRFAELVRTHDALRNLGTPAGNNLFSRWDRWAMEDSFNGHYCTTMTIAAFFDFARIIEQQLAAGVAVDDDTVFGITPFLYAVHGDALEAAKLLIDRGANPTALSEPGYGAARYVSRNCISVLPVILGINGPWDTHWDHDDGRTVFHNVASTVGWHPSIVSGFIGLSKTEALDCPDFLGRTALHRAASINIQEAVTILWGRLSGETGSGKQKKQRILSSSLEEAFTPNSLAGISTWAKAWSGVFGIADSDLDLSSPQQQSFSYMSIHALAVKIRAYILKEVVLRKPKLDAQDELGRTPLHMAVHAAWGDRLDTDPVELIAVSGSKRRRGKVPQLPATAATESSLGILLANGADPFIRDRVGRLPADVAVARGDWQSATLLLAAMVSQTGLPDDEQANLKHLRVLLDETNNTEAASIVTPSDTAWMLPGDQVPRSYRDMIETALILQNRLAVSPSAQKSQRNPRLTKVVRHIMDLAGYWGPVAMSVDVSASTPWPPKLSISLKSGMVRRIEFFIAAPSLGGRSRSGRYWLRGFRDSGLLYASSAYGWYHEVIEDNSDRDGIVVVHHRGGVAGPLPRISGGHHREPGEGSSVFNADKDILHWVGPGDEAERAATLLDQEKALVMLPPIVGDTSLWGKVHSSGTYELDKWKQTWPILSTSTKRHRTLGSQTKNWMESLREGDMITLTTAEGFSIQDVSKFCKFGVVIYFVL